MPQASSLYQQNLTALSAIYPGAAHLLRSLPESPAPEPPDFPSLKDFAAQQVARRWSPEAELHLVCRCSNRFLLDRLLAKIQPADMRCPRSRRLLLLEDRPAQLRQAFQLWNWTRFISSDRCLWGIDHPQQEVLRRLLQRYPDLTQTRIQVYSGDPALDERKLEEIAAEWHRHRAAVGNALRAGLQRMRSPLPSVPRRLRFMVAGHNIFQDACVEALRQLGYDAARLQWQSPLYPFIRATAWTREFFASGFDTALFLNATPQTFSGWLDFSTLPLQCAAWFVDNPRRFVRSRQDFNGCGVVGVFDAAYLPALQRLTDAELLELRTGCGIGARHVTDRSLYQAVDLAFVGELGTRGYLPLESLFRQHDPQSLTVAQEVLHSIDPTQPIFLDPLAEEAFHARGLEYFGAQVEYLENRATALRRRHFLEPLAAQGLKIFGDAEWSDPALAGPLTQAYTGRRLNYTTQLPNLYASAKINLNIFHVQCVAAPNPRVYDVLACGGFLLTSANQGLTDEFEAGRELVVFHDRQELREQVEYYLSHPQEREEIARRGQAKVLAKYGYQDRMQTLLTTLISNRGEPYVYICR